MGEFVEAGYIDRLDEDRVGIHITGSVTYEIPTPSIQNVLWNGLQANAFQRVPQTVLDGSGNPDVPLMPAGILTLSRTRRSVTFRTLNVRLY